MPTQALYPIKLTPTLKSALWGGTRLSDSWQKETPGTSVAESWELTVREKEHNLIANGPHAGKTLTDLLHTPEGALILGTVCEGMTRFPLLIKFIDAAQSLSVQIHPDDDYAARVEHDSGKNEMWYIVEAAPDAEIVYGLKAGVTADDFRCAVDEHRIAEVLNFRPVKPGECYYIPAGLVHAIGGGILIAEIQQNSDLTYRVYDYDRRDANGNLRELHCDKACDVVCAMTESDIAVKRYAANPSDETDDACLAHPPYFRVCRRTCTPDHPHSGTVAQDCFLHLLCLSGESTVETPTARVTMSRGDSIFLPANLGAYTIRGTAEWLESRV